jgi:drug/metabolite transporter (DMT)-like permease
LRHTTPTRASAFQTLSPITALLLGALLLGEPVTSAMLGGLALVVLGLWVAHRPEPAARAPLTSRRRDP